MSQSYKEQVEALKCLAACPMPSPGSYIAGTVDMRIHAARIAATADAALAAAREERDALRAENEALKRDAERLDWMERQDLESLAMCIVKDGPNDGEYMVYGDGVPGFGKTFRGAIDDAIGPALAAIAGRAGA